MGPVQSALLTTLAALAPSKRRKEASWVRMVARLARTAESSSRLRSDERPLGSPIMPVAPPTTAMGLCPARCRWAIIMMGTKLPTWRLRAVGSKPT